MSLSEPQKDAFSDWVLDLLKDATTKATILAAKPGVTFDTPGIVTLLESKETAYDGKEGIVTGIKAQLVTANKNANDALNDWYKESSNVADAIVGHCGKDHPLSKEIRNKRDSFTHASPAPATP